MPEGRGAEGRDVLLAHVQPAPRQGPRPRHLQERLTAAGTGPVPDQAAHRFRRLGAVGVGGEQEPRDPLHDLLRHRHLPDQRARAPHLLPAQHGIDGGRGGRAGGGLQDGDQLRLGGVADLDLELEAIELRLRQGVGPLHLDRVLGGHQEEGFLQRKGLAEGGDLPLLHRLQQGRLRARGGPVDLVGQEHVREDGAALECEVPPPLGVLLQHASPQDVPRHQVGGELDAPEAKVESGREAPHQRRLAQTRNALDQRVSAAEQAEEQLLDHLLLTQESPADGLLERRQASAQGLQLALQIGQLAGFGGFGFHGRWAVR